MTETHRQSELRRAENEVVFKSHNERIQEHAENLLDADARNELPLSFVCECSNEDCHEKLEMPVAEFEQLRSNSRQFIVKAGHEKIDIEHVVEKRGDTR